MKLSLGTDRGEPYPDQAAEQRVVDPKQLVALGGGANIHAVSVSAGTAALGLWG
jgi:hypothetical protein